MDLPSNAKLSEIQQNMHGLVQLIGAATLDVPNQTPTTTAQTNAQCVPYTTKGPVHNPTGKGPAHIPTGQGQSISLT